MLKTFAIAFFVFFPLIAIPRITTANSPSRTTINQLLSKETENSCPTDLEDLTSLLIQDLPDYGNRVIQRTQDSHRDAGIDTYIIAVGQPEFEPLNLPQINYNGDITDTTEQIFFTTLERQYTNQQKVERQTYHWLFVTMTDNGWQMFTMFSRFGTATKNKPPTPPQESSNGIVGQAVSLWLRDCLANTLR